MELEINEIVIILGNVINEINNIEETKLKQSDIVVELQGTLRTAIEKINELSLNNKDITEQLSALKTGITNQFFNIFNDLSSAYYPDSIKKYELFLSNSLSLLAEIKRLDYLSLINDKNVILVGGNGVGKSSFASYLKDSMSINIVVVPAQKFLFYDKMINLLHLTHKEVINDIQKDNFIKRGRFQYSCVLQEESA
ncbi:hypothetical protein [Sporosarcina ureae]|uniref:hypothetical protein n=1 Tax=Sporosarcina ureae TaxID=1571 RepID=UPI0009DC5A7A|nr:hypothetical protein [Sporosarcina ureae]ARF18220.1 hypothetical protein SporoP17a_13585 [Sporosarcina ureae]